MTTWTVEAQFDGATWTDITEWCEDIRTRRGRSTDLDVVEAGVCQILLWNQDGRFTPENTQGSYVSGGASQILPGVAVRLRTVAGTSSDPRGLFVGEADRWEPLWDADGNAFVQVDVIDGFEKLRRVEIDYPLQSVVMTNDPDGYWPLGSRGTTQPDLIAGRDLVVDSDTVTPGSDPIVAGGDGSIEIVGTAGVFPQVWNAKTAPATWAGDSNDITFSCWIEPVADWADSDRHFFSVVEGGFRSVGGLAGFGGINGWDLHANAGDLMFETWNGGTPDFATTGALTWTIGQRYHVGFWWDQSAGEVTIYRNGTAYGPYSVSAPGAVAQPNYGFIWDETGDTTRVSDAAIWTSDKSSLLTGDLYDSGDGFASDLPGARIGRLLDWAGWPSVDRAVDTGTTSLAGIDANTTVLAACQDAAAADNGIFFVTKDGYARFAGRRERWEGSYSDTYSDTYTDDGGIRATFDDDGTDTPYEQVGWRYDTTLLHNAVTVDSNTQGVSDGYAEDATSVGVYGRRTLTISTISNDTDDNLHRAAWEVSRRKGPHLRLELLASSSLDEDEQEAAAGLELGDLVQVSRRPGASQDDITVDLRVASIAHHIGGGGLAWSVDFGLTEAETDQPGVYGIAVYGTDYYGY